MGGSGGWQFLESPSLHSIHALSGALGFQEITALLFFGVSDAQRAFSSGSLAVVVVNVVPTRKRGSCTDGPN